MYLLRLICLAFIGFILYNCDEKVETDPITVQRLIAHKWKVKEVFKNGQSDLITYRNFQIQFSGVDYRTQNGGAAFPEFGEWTFADDTHRVIDRGDGVSLSIISLNDSELVIGFYLVNTNASGHDRAGLKHFRFELIRG